MGQCVDFSSGTKQSDVQLLIMTEIRGNTTAAANTPSVVNRLSVSVYRSVAILYNAKF